MIFLFSSPDVFDLPIGVAKTKVADVEGKGVVYARDGLAGVGIEWDDGTV